jgi:mono/diheme cytochrome c family protein
MLASAAAISMAMTPGQAAAQATRPPKSTSTASAKGLHLPSTLDGVYTEAQAKRGKDVYFGNCRSCHSAESHTGATFAQWWKGKQLSDLFVFIATKMPKNDPGSLAPEDAADVVAYLLKMNVMPVGKHDLPPDVDSLAKFRIETRPAKASAASGSTSKGKKP